MKKHDKNMPPEAGEDMPPESGDDFEAFEEYEGEEEAGFAEEGEEEAPTPEEKEEQEPPAEEEEAPPKAAPEREVDTSALDLAPDVPVQVVAVMGKRGVTIKELMEMRMGQVIDLKRPPNETVDVVVNGKLFARGELVEIDGKLGVKILKLVR